MDIILKVHYSLLRILCNRRSCHGSHVWSQTLPDWSVAPPSCLPASSECPRRTQQRGDTFWGPSCGSPASGSCSSSSHSGTPSCRSPTVCSHSRLKADGSFINHTRVSHNLQLFEQMSMAAQTPTLKTIFMTIIEDLKFSSRNKNHRVRGKEK